ncbi:MAG: MCE family protein [Nitrospirae bacterium]|nr:MAG: MCE family protein [Nitrospirota bacterium]
MEYDKHTSLFLLVFPIHAQAMGMLMSRRANPTLIGLFVLGALVLLFIGVIVFGADIFLSKRIPWVLYFEESIKGLHVGAPVNFRGVKIGVVTDIKVVLDPKTNSIRTPVYIEIEEARITQTRIPVTDKRGVIHRLVNALFSMELDTFESRQQVQKLIQQGLRAQLEMQSFVTGKLSIGLDFHPNTPITLHHYDDPYPEFPTIPTRFEKLTTTLEDVPIDQLVTGIIRAIHGIERLVTAPEWLQTLTALEATLQSFQDLAQTLETNADSLSARLEHAIEAGQGALVQLEKTLALEEGQPGRLARKFEEAADAARAAMDQAHVALAFQEGPTAQLIEELHDTTQTAQATLRQAQKTLVAAQHMVDERSPLGYELTTTLHELAAAARAIRHMAEYLERHPEALFYGKTPNP